MVLMAFPVRTYEYSSCFENTHFLKYILNCKKKLINNWFLNFTLEREMMNRNSFNPLSIVKYRVDADILTPFSITPLTATSFPLEIDSINYLFADTSISSIFLPS